MKRRQPFSVRNAFEAERARPCACRAYVDILNKSLWRSLGFVPLPQAEGTRCRVLRFTARGKQRRVILVAQLFCRCQVFNPATVVRNLYFNEGANR
jgi:hypothetical protein